MRGTDGKELGQVRDFLIDPQAGQVRFAVVSSGGWAGIGDTLHVVPFTALKAANRGANDDDKQDFTVAVSQSQWKNAPTIKEDSFEEGRVTLDPQIEQQVAQTFQSSSSSGNQNANGALLRASKIRGRDVMANGQDIGSIEGVVLQPGHSDAMALIDPDDDFAGGEQKYVVPLTKLQIANVGNGSVNTQLTRNDFRAVTNSSAGATASSTASTAVTGSTMGTTSDAAISPTGSTSGFSSDTTSTDTLSTGSSSGTTTLSTDSTQASSTTGNSTTSTGTPQP